MATGKEYLIKLTIEGDKVIQTVVNLDDELAKAGKQAKKTGNEISGAMREARSGVIGIVNDLTGGLASKFMDVKDAIGGATAGMKGFNAALIGTGIGALVVALGAIVGYKDDLVNMFYDSTINLSDLNKQAEDHIKLADELKSSWSLQERALRALGTEESKILDLRKKNIELQITQQELALEALKTAAIDAAVESKAIEKMPGGVISQYVLGTEEKAAETLQKYNDAKKMLADAKVSLLETGAAITANEKKEQEDRVKLNAEYQQKRQEQDVEAEKSRIESIGMTTIQTRQMIGQLQVDVEREIETAKTSVVALSTEERAKLEKEAADKSYKLQQDRISYAVDSLSVLSGALDAFASNNERSQKRAFGVGKALAAASATINTLQAITGVFKSAAENPTSVLFPGYPFVQAGIMAAAGFAQVKKILSQNFTGGSGSTGGGSASFAGGAGGEGGGFSGFQNIQPQAPTNQLINPQAQSQPVQAYVLAGNVSSETEARKKIQDQARL
jgi:hypothetical protein